MVYVVLILNLLVKYLMAFQFYLLVTLISFFDGHVTIQIHITDSLPLLVTFSKSFLDILKLRFQVLNLLLIELTILLC